MERRSLRWVGGFVGLTYLISWVLWTPLVVVDDLPGGPILGVLGSFGPAAAAVIVTRWRFGSLRPLTYQLRRWRIGWRWWLAVIALPVAGVAVAATLARAVGVAGPQPEPGWVAFPAVLVFSTLLGGGQEEPGWRGLAQVWLAERWSPLAAALAVGVVWAVWHAPLFLVEGSTQEALGLDPLVYGLSVPALAVLVAWIHEATGSSLPAAAVFHGALNAATVVGFPFGGVGSQVLLTAVAWGAALTVAALPDSPVSWRRRASEGVARSA